MSASRLPASRLRDLDDALLVLRAHRDELLRAGDPRGVFATAYVEVTHKLDALRRDGALESPAWVSRLAARFADYYLDVSPDDASAPECWRFAAEVARARPGSTLEHLLLGMVAHILHDLPLALADTLAEEPPERCRRDYERLLAALAESVQPIVDALSAEFSPGLGLLDRLSLGRGRALVFLALALARAQGWRRAERIAGAPWGRARARGRFDAEACGVARQLSRLFARPSVSWSFEQADSIARRGDTLTRRRALDV